MKNVTQFLKASLLLSFLILQIASIAQVTAPDNDLICDAIPISVSLGCTEGTNVGATISETAFAPSCWTGGAVAATISNDVWYKFVATVPGMTVSTDVQGLSLNNTQVAIYSSSDNSCSGVLTQVGCSDNSGTNVQNNTIINMASLTPGTTYFIRVDGSGSATGNFCINVSNTYVPGSTPCEAQIVYPNNLSCEVPSGNNRNDNGNRINNTITPVGYFPPIGIDYCGGDDETNQYGTWSIFTANATSVNITNQVGGAGTSGERDYTLFSATGANQCTPTCISSASVSPTGTATFSGLTIGSKYLILTTLRKGLTTTGFKTDMCVKSTAGCTPPANDHCADAQDITADQLYLVSTLCADGDGSPNLCDGGVNNTIWFNWKVPSSWTGDAFFQLYQQNCTQGNAAQGSQVSVFSPWVKCGDVANCDDGAVSNTSGDNNITIVWTPVPNATYLISYDGHVHEVCTMKFQITNKASTNDITVNSTEICPGGTAVLTASGANSYIWDNGETTASITVSPSVTTSYNVTSTSGKIGSAIGFVIVKPLPMLSSSLTVTACSKQVFNYDPTSVTSGTTYKWKRAAVPGISNVAASGTSDPNETLINTTMLPVNVTYTYTTTANGCNNSPGENVVVKVNPNIVIPNQTAVTICSGQTFSVSPTNGVPTVATKIPVGTGYTWSVPSMSPAATITGGVAVTSPQSYIHQALTNLTYSLSTVTYTVTPVIDGCADTKFTVGVKVRPSDNSTFNYPKSTYCMSDYITDTVAIKTGLPGGIFNSTPALNSFNTTTGYFKKTLSPVGTYTVTYITNGTCIDTSSFNVTLTTGPDATFNYSSLKFCKDVTPNPTPIFTGISSAGVFTSTPSGLSFVSNQSGEINMLTSATGTYTVTNTIAAAGLCPAIANTYTVTLNPVPTMSVTTTAQTICSGSTMPTITLTPSFPSTITWMAADNAKTTGESVTAKSTTTINDVITSTSLSAKTVVYTVTYTTTPQGCVGSPKTITVLVNPTPVMTNTVTSTTICSGTAISPIALTADINSTFKWSATQNFANITGESITSQSSFTLTNTLTNTTQTDQTITYSVMPTSSPVGCPGVPQLITVKVNPKPVLTNTFTMSPICSEGTAVLALTSSVNSTYTWSATPNSNITGEQTTSITGSTINDADLINSTSVVQTLSYTVKATSDIGGCVSLPQTITVKVNPKPSITTTKTSATICSGEAFKLPIAANIGSTFTWIATDNLDTQGEEIVTAQTTNTITNTITNKTNLQQTINYSATPISTATPACTGTSKTFTVVVNPGPKMTSIESTVICGDGKPLAIELTSDVNSTYLWSASANASISGESTTPKTTALINDILVNDTEDSQSLNYVVTPKSVTGKCTGTAQTIEVTMAKPIAKFTHDTDYGTPPMSVNFSNNSEGANTYMWSFGDENFSTDSDPSHTYFSANTFTVKLIASQDGMCADSTTSTILAYQFFVANVFTPNGDGNSDAFAVKHDGLTSLDIEIFNRWGIKLFEAHEPDAKWDGRNTNGKEAEDGTYYYIIKAKGIDGEEYTQKGFVTLIR